MKRILSIVLAAVLMLALAGCGADVPEKLKIGSVTFSLADVKKAQEQGTLSWLFTLNEEDAWVAVAATDVVSLDESTAQLLSQVQLEEALEAYPAREGESELTLYFADTAIPCRAFAAEGAYHIVGTYLYDGYAYTLDYCSPDAQSGANAQFVSLLAGSAYATTGQNWANGRVSTGEETDIGVMETTGATEETQLLGVMGLEIKASMPVTEIYNQNGLKLTVQGMERDGGNVSFSLQAQNNTDKNIAFSCENFVVNGITVPGSLYIKLTAGKHGSGSLSFRGSDLSLAGIGEIGTVSATECHVIYTDTAELAMDIGFSFRTSYTMLQQVDKYGDVVYNQGGIKVTLKRYGESGSQRKLTLLLENNSATDRMIQAEVTSVNDIAVYAASTVTVYSGTCRFTELYLSQTALEDNEVEKVEKITFLIQVADNKTLVISDTSGEITLTLREH